MKIELIGDYDYNDCQVLKRVIHHLQLQLDINPQILQDWLDRDQFDTVLLDNDRHCYRQIMDQENPVLDRLMDVSHAESFIDEALFWEKEACGQIMDECGNGYIKYCNQHKYLHPSEHSRKSQKSKIDHFFVKKNPNEILEEQIFKVKFNMYLQITRNLAQRMENEFYQWIDREGYQQYFIESDHAESVVNWLREHPKSFRSKYPIYQRDLNEIRREKKHRETRTLRSLRTLKALKGIKDKTRKLNQAKGKNGTKGKNKQGDSNNLSSTDEDSDESNDTKVYLKVYATEQFELPGVEIISRSML